MTMSMHFFCIYFFPAFILPCTDLTGNHCSGKDSRDQEISTPRSCYEGGPPFKGQVRATNSQAGNNFLNIASRTLTHVSFRGRFVPLIMKLTSWSLGWFSGSSKVFATLWYVQVKATIVEVLHFVSFCLDMNRCHVLRNWWTCGFSCLPSRVTHKHPIFAKSVELL